MHHFNGEFARTCVLVEGILNVTPIAHQNDPVPEFAGRTDGAFNLGNRGLIAPHRVYCNGDHSLRLSRFDLVCVPYSAAVSMTSRPLY
jgi:hypothetical protein